MRGVEASIDLAGLGLKGGQRICIIFMDPAIYIHGTRAEMVEFARQIVEKSTPAERLFTSVPNGDIEIKGVTL